MSSNTERGDMGCSLYCRNLYRQVACKKSYTLFNSENKDYRSILLLLHTVEHIFRPDIVDAAIKQNPLKGGGGGGGAGYGYAGREPLKRLPVQMLVAIETAI